MRGLRLFVVAVVIVAVLAASFVYIFYFSAGPTTTSSSVISTPTNLVAVVQPTPQTACGGRSYSNSSLTINWGNLAPGTYGIQYLCVENTGTTPATLVVSSTLSPSIGKITSPQVGKVLNGGGIIEVELDLWISTSIQPGPIPAFTIMVGANS